MEILSPAKINLFLHITGKRPDGYHEIFSLMSCVELADSICLDFDTDRILIVCNNDQVPGDSTNLAFRAASVFFEQSGIRPGVTISIDKNIPVSGGLGGGSSNAAAVLNGLNRHFNNPVSQSQLHNMAAGIGADVPFFLYGEPALATGIGDCLVSYHLLDQLPVIIINPNFSVSTEKTYKNYNFELTNDKNKVKSIIFTQKTIFNETYLENDLEKVTVAWHPEISRAKQKLLNHGATGALMSGSGPSVFGIFPDTGTAEKAYSLLYGHDNERTFLTRLLTGNDAVRE